MSEYSGKSTEQLRQESSDWHKNNRHKGYYMHDCPDWSQEHNRSIELDKRDREASASLEAWSPYD